ncbi:GNAT family N-acetyltransferase [Chimaeribacter californicus]|uniref:GNAT family N-acetyltransferase n=1 Tax=Chimaeribacter californicus TaxID=2060067 RepID=A0A2N5DZQ0_9GAMM|nr:GNAT family N-acetyltransferase [Chimaeribacter californicus]PLR33331.1 GNAT family N-acetyltransferase [Chimaeribacter californicus]
MFQIAEVDTASAELATLVAELDAFQGALYPAESNHCIDLAAIGDEHLRCVLMRDAKGNPAGCGAVYLQGDGAAEIKRMYIRPAYRGQQLGEKIIACLETLAADAGCTLLRLETGIHQQPAIALYQRCGYAFCPPFPPYKEDPLSRFMVKRLRDGG